MKRRPKAKAVSGTPQALAAEVAVAIDHLRNARLDEAEAALQGVLKRAAGHPDALHYLGVLRHTQGHAHDAVTLMTRSLSAWPDNASAWNILGNVLLLAERGSEAAEAYVNAVKFSRARGTEGAMAFNNLGVLFRKLDRLDESERALRRAVVLAPEFGDGWYNLANTLIRAGRNEEGLVAHSKAVAAWPEHGQARHEVLRALLLLGESERATKLLREWLAADPENPVAMHLLAANAGTVAPERASDEYVRQLFNGFAASFDSSLAALDYRAPDLVTRALEQAAGAPAANLDIVDAGCGTGLCGAGLRPFARRLNGCDLSPGMLLRAKEGRLYDTLSEAELTHYLASQPGAYDAVVSADTLCYFGALEDVLAGAQSCLRPHGWLIFTVEALSDGDPRPYVLQVNGRYAHEQGYLRRALAAANFEVRAMQHDTLRKEAGEPVLGWVVTAQRGVVAATQ